MCQFIPRLIIIEIYISEFNVDVTPSKTLISMSANSSNELLEPQLSPQRSREKLVRNLLVNKPEIFRVSGPGILDQVKSFLPQMAEAENQLNQAVARDGGEKYNVENVRDDQRVVEMDIAVLGDGKKEEEDDWTSDSDADSTPSPSENSYTSDTDISSSSTCSSSSCDETPKSQNK